MIPIAKTHRTATLFSSELTENLINDHRYSSPKHQNIITISAALPPITKTPQHHRHRAETSTNTKPSHQSHITKTSQHNHHTSPRHTRDITDTSFKDHQNVYSAYTEKHLNISSKKSLKYLRDITELSIKHKQNITKIITETSPKHNQDITKI